jgi:GWxTD domain-containing protein
MKRLLLFLLFLGSQAVSQPLQNINYSFLYNPDPRLSFQFDIIPTSKDSLTIVYQVSAPDTLKAGEYTLTWEQFESLAEKKGVPFTPIVALHTYGSFQHGTFSISSNGPNIIAARLQGTVQNQVSYYYKVVDRQSPLNGYALVNNQLISGYVSIPDIVTLTNNQSASTVFFYEDEFPAAAAPFAETQGSISRSWKPDSVFSITTTLKPSKKGLYLIQADTTSAKGVCFRAEDNYPKYSTLQNLVGPLTYITTKSEFEKLRTAQGDKKAFDKIILTITGNAERAKLFMRSYYRRVELANRFFTSFKEGWKTDRGMVYIVFGQPETVYRFQEREVWEYTTSDGEKISFTFVRSSSLFDPDNYVLIRKRSYEDVWLQVVDLTRKARF